MHRSWRATACTTTSARSHPGWTWSTRSRSATRFDRSTSAPLEENPSGVGRPGRLRRDRVRLFRPVCRHTSDRERKSWTLGRTKRLAGRGRLQHVQAGFRGHLFGWPQGRGLEGRHRGGGHARAERDRPVHRVAYGRPLLRLEPPAWPYHVHVSDRRVAGHWWLG